MSSCKVVCRFLLIALHFIAFRAVSAAASSSVAIGTACSHASGGVQIVATELAGVPAILRIAARMQKPPIVLWHGFGPPASEQALMDALPLDECLGKGRVR